MLVNSTNSSSTPTPGSCSSISNTLEPPFKTTPSNTNTNTSSSVASQPPQMLNSPINVINNSRPPSSRVPSILDSPTLARVERARLRLEASNQQYQQQQQLQQQQQQCIINSSRGSSINTLNYEDSLERSILDPKQSLLAGRLPVAAMTGPIKRGLLWQQRDRLFSRWKERYFVLTRDYLHCFKRASGSANERASDMGQFIFKVKLVDVEKVEWLNRRSYSAIGLLLGREGRVLLRCDEGLEDWFELLEECTIISKERRHALKIAQGPRSRASLAAPVSHASLQSKHSGLGSHYTSALDDWLIANGSGIGGISSRPKLITNSMCGYGGNSTFLISDSVPDLSALNNENHNYNNGLSTNHSTPQKLPYSATNNHYQQHSRYSNGYSLQHNTLNNSNGFYGSPRRILVNSSFGSDQIVDEEAEEGEVELRRPRIFRNYSTENGNELDRDWLYRKPLPPTDLRHSVQPILPTTSPNNVHDVSIKLANDVDYSAHDSGLDTPPPTHRPSSYRELTGASSNNTYYNSSHQQQQQQQLHQRQQQSPRNSTETTISSSRGTMINSPGGSFKAKQLQKHITNIAQMNALKCSNTSRFSVQEQKRPVLTICNEELGNRTNQMEYYDPNQNRYYITEHQTSGATPQHTSSNIVPAHNTNSNSNNNGMMYGNVTPLNSSTIFRERYQHPALTAIINEAQGLKFRDRSYSDCQQLPARRTVNNNPSPLSNRRNHINPIFGTPTRV